MEDNMRKAFDAIRAEDALKQTTLSHLKEKVFDPTPKSKKIFNTLKPRFYARMIVATSLVVLLLFVGSFSYNSYFTAYAYVDIDINPSIGLSLNQFDRVISVSAYNDEGQDIVSAVDLEHKTYEDATKLLVDQIHTAGYAQGDDALTVTVQSPDATKQTHIIEALQKDLSSCVEQHMVSNVSVFPVDSSTKMASHNLNVSPARYMAVQEANVVDPTINMEGCRNMSLTQIKQHHTNVINAQNTDDTLPIGPTESCQNMHNGSSHHHD